MIEKAATVISEILYDVVITAELIFIDDGSEDGTWNRIVETSSKCPGTVREVHFSRNL